MTLKTIALTSPGKQEIWYGQACKLNQSPPSPVTALSSCAGFGWCRVKFLYNSLYAALFWICARNC